MADYSYAELSQMQREAVQRVQEMRKRAKTAAEDAARKFADEGQTAQIKQTQSAEAPAACPRKQNSHGQSGRCCKKRENASDIISKLFAGKGIQADDADMALILSVCFLLYAEKADEELILALLYLLT